MPTDPTGTSPQPVPTRPPEEVVDIKCHRQGCDSITANPQVIGSGSQRLYRCTKCKHTWGINVGGHIDI
jgi:DNA-directed RNA polymerase subunit M/transcription elongation factor TFIIS